MEVGKEEAAESVDVRVAVPHVRQMYHWDCGLACMQMVLQYFNVEQDDFKQLCKKLNFGDSVWTIDLAHMLDHYGIRHMFCTITVGVDKGYSNKNFYKDRFTADELRVNQLFDNATMDGVILEKRSVTIDEITSHLSQRKLLIVLVDWSHLNCKWCMRQRFLSAVSCSCIGKCINVYQGHFVIVCGYNEKERLVYYKNPSLGIELCCCTVKTFESARKSYGTDEDLVFIYDRVPQRNAPSTAAPPNNEGENNKKEEVS